MKGHPFREVLIFLVVALGLLFPMAQLRSVQSDHLRHEHDSSLPEGDETVHVDAFADLRLSHPADRMMLKVDGKVLLEETQTRRTDFELCLTGQGAAVEVTIFWSELEQGQPFAELRVEPDNRPDQIYSFWGKEGENLHRWFVKPGAPE